jgi:hypothetical protein
MLKSILSASVPRNERRGLSGALLACDRWFLQALEGDRLVIGETYQRICRDPRHHDTKIISSGPIADRSFAGWSMCGGTLTATDDAILQTLQTKKAFHPMDLSGKSALKLLEVIKKLQNTGPTVSYI